MPKLTELWDKLLTWGLTRENILVLVLLCQMGMAGYGVAVGFPWLVAEQRASNEALNRRWQESIDKNTEALRDAIKASREEREVLIQLLRTTIQGHPNNLRGEVEHDRSDVGVSGVFLDSRPVGAL